MAILALHPRKRHDVAHLYGRWICPPAFWLLGIRVEIRSRERLTTSRPCIFIPNHQHILDLFVFGALLPPATITVAKRSLRWVPIFGWLYPRCGHLFIDRSSNAKAVAVMREAQRKIRERGLSVLLAPEGTRSQGKGLLPFKRGAFHLAIATGRQLQPIAISSFHKELSYWRVRSGTVLIELLEPIPTDGVTRETMDVLIATAHGRISAAIEALDAELLAQRIRRTS